LLQRGFRNAATTWPCQQLRSGAGSRIKLCLTNVATVINTLKGFDNEAQAAVICTLWNYQAAVIARTHGRVL
jgi:hypothetical protein